MKTRYILITLFILLTVLSKHVFAQTISPSITQKPEPTASDSSIIEKSSKFVLDKLAAQVAKNDKKNTVITGLFESFSNNTVTLNALDGKKYTIPTDDIITKIYSVSGTKTEIKTSDLTKGDYMIVDGSIVDTTINTNTIYIDQQYIVTSGKVTDIDTTAGTVRVLTVDKEDVVVSVVLRKTKITLVDAKTLTLSTATIAKIKEGDTIHFVGVKPEGTKLQKLNADQLLILPQEMFIKSK